MGHFKVSFSGFKTARLFASSTHAQGTFPEPLESASNSFVCTRETALLWTVFNRTSNNNNDDVDDIRPRRAQLIRFPRDKACRSAAVACEQCLATYTTSSPATVIQRNCSGSGSGSAEGENSSTFSNLIHATLNSYHCNRRPGVSTNKSVG